MSGENSGAIVIIYRRTDSNFEFLLPTRKGGIVNFVGGSKQEWDRTYEATIRRKIAQDTSLEGSDYSIRQTDISHKFPYEDGSQPDKVSTSWHNKVFIAEVNSDMEISPSSELESLDWYSEEEATARLSFKDMKPVFQEAVEMIKRKHE